MLFQGSEVHVQIVRTSALETDKGDSDLCNRDRKVGKLCPAIMRTIIESRVQCTGNEREKAVLNENSAVVLSVVNSKPGIQ